MERILLIDDDRLNRRVFRMILSKEGYDVIEAEDGDTGLRMVKSDTPDIVITDFLMPGINGLDVLSEIRKLKIYIPVIMLTAFGDFALTNNAIQLGAFDLLEKPVSPEHLKTTVSNAIKSVKRSVSHV